MALQGWDIEMLRNVVTQYGTTDSILRDMAGNAFTKGVCNDVIVGLLVHLRIPSEVHVKLEDPEKAAASAASAVAALDALMCVGAETP